MLKNLRRVVKTFREVRASDQDVKAGIRFFDAVSLVVGRGERKMARLMRSSDAGRRALESRHSLFELITNRDRLRSLPNGTLGREYVRFADERQIYPEQFEALLAEAIGRSSADTDHGSDEARFVHDRYRHLHDVWHVVLGYDTDPDGELGILACMGRQNGYRAHYIAAFVQALVAGLQGDAHRLRVFARGWRRARRTECLIVQDWDALFVLPLSTVRSRLNLYPLPEPAPAPPAEGTPAAA